MDLSDPTQSITATLDGPVLAALAGAGKPLTVSEVTSLSARGSEIGVRKSLGRLVGQGVVSALELGKSRVYSLNRDHVAAGIAIELGRLRGSLWRRTAREIERWNVRPLYACIFGSAARGEGDSSSDIDLLLVRPSTLAEWTEARRSKSVLAELGMWAEVIATRVMSDRQIKGWNSNIDAMHELVRTWTGNPLQVVNISAFEWSEHRHVKSAIYRNIRKDEVRLYDEFSPVTYHYPKD